MDMDSVFPAILDNDSDEIRAEKYQKQSETFDTEISPHIFNWMSDIAESAHRDGERRAIEKVARLLMTELPSPEWSEDEVIEWLEENVDKEDQ
ncbi:MULTISPECIES: hypothetical protein [unclassified Halomonas]|uniref:hypothetical protein n=1 Tax=unclassified Halomonas TaxID=2609666 RepID=UPI002076AB5A|nr:MULTISPECIES: hypothetical protein [unclassified Halomonas]